MGALLEMTTVMERYQIGVYKRQEVITFRKTKEQFGGLSNMASGTSVESCNKTLHI